MPAILFDKKQISYKVFGNGPVVILLHGLGENGDVFLQQINYLKDDFRLIIPDLPGSGQSELLDRQPSLDDFAGIIFEIAKKEAPSQKFSLFGHSMGGYTTMAFVERYAGHLTSFGLLHSSAFPDTEEKKETRTKAIAFIKKNGGATFLKTITPELFSEESQSKHPEFISELLKLSSNMSDQALIQYYHAMINRPDRSALLKTSPVPVFFLAGKYDKVVPIELSKQQSALPKVSDAHVLEHSAHMGIWEETDAANAALKGFLKKFHR